MKKKIKIMVSMILAVAITVSMAAFTASAKAENVSIETIDELLREANTPENKIATMDDELKRFIYENSLSQNKVEYIDVTQEPSTVARSGYTISTSDLKLSVSAFKVYGADQVDVYPSYEWLVPTKPNGKDYFGYSIHDSYSAVAGKRSNLIWSKMDKDDAWGDPDEATYTGSSLTGYEHQGSDLGTPDFKIYIKGNFYYRVDIDSSSPVKKIVLAYVHDTSWGGYSYSVGYGPFSISVTPSSNSVGYQNNVYNLNY